MGDQTSRIEVIWGHRLLDEGFTAIPNIIIRNYRKLGIEHGEWGLICTILTYKHDTKDPFPSQETLAEHLGVKRKQIGKWVDGLVEKGLLRVGQRRNKDSKKFGNAVYNFRPLIDAALALVGESPLSDSAEDEWDIEYRTPCTLEGGTEPRDPEGDTESTLEGGTDLTPEGDTKRTIKNNNMKITNNNNVAVIQEQIESHLGTSIASLSKHLPKWLKQYGENKLLDIARYIGSTPEKWDKSIVGAYRTAVTEDWDIPAGSGYLDEPVRDERYGNFYELFPEA